MNPRLRAGGTLALPAALLLAGISAGFAASLPAWFRTLGAARVTIPRCTTSALTVLNNLSGGSVVSVTIGGLPASCGGATIQAAVNNGAASSSGSGAVPAGGGSVTVTLAAAVTVSTAQQTDVVVTGP